MQCGTAQWPRDRPGITGSAAGRNIFGPEVFSNSDRCNGPCFIDNDYRSNCTEPCACVGHKCRQGGQ
ncbi:hypothetical protein V5799_015404 [Amblyomma americanum]|uniref:Uncharacterized protein n=1 Tax=Amblyomma americanum TaxID=6943 RepID=A0AAQ4F960_AMBAM